MAIYFFVGITLIIIALLGFALSESHGKNSPHARNKNDQFNNTLKTAPPPVRNHPFKTLVNSFLLNQTTK